MRWLVISITKLIHSQKSNSNYISYLLLSAPNNVTAFSGKGHMGCIELSENSIRINISFQKNDELECLLCLFYSRFLCKRADYFDILRRVPAIISNMMIDITFLLSEQTERKYEHSGLAKLLIDYCQEYTKDITYMKIYTNSKSRSVGAQFFNEFN